MQSMTGARPADSAGKTLGIIVFLLGVGLLIAVFVLAYLDLVAAAQSSGLSRLLNLPATLLYKGALLFIMGVVSSAIANKGIALYQAARPSE